MKFRDRHSSKNPVKAYGFDSKKNYKKFPPLSLKQRYKNEVFGAFKNPSMMAKAKAVYALMKNYPNLKMYKELDLFQRIGFNKSYKEAQPRNRTPFSLIPQRPQRPSPTRSSPRRSRHATPAERTRAAGSLQDIRRRLNLRPSNVRLSRRLQRVIEEGDAFVDRNT